jgi:hypothetical protein
MTVDANQRDAQSTIVSDAETCDSEYERAAVDEMASTTLRRHSACTAIVERLNSAAVGQGGQCRIFNSRLQIDSYTLVNSLSPTRLALAYPWW